MDSNTTDLMLKLFDTLKQASDKTESALQKLINQQNEIIGHIQYMPIKEIQDSIDDHEKSSDSKINDCTKTVNSSSAGIIEKLRRMNNRVTVMIVVVLSTFTVLSAAYLIGSFAADKNNKAVKSTYLFENKVVIDMIQKEFEKIRHEIKESREK